MKVALVLSSNLWYAPFLKLYTSVLDLKNVEYDVISWNRDGRDPQCWIQYSKVVDYKSNKIKKTIPSIGYLLFVRKTLLKNNYSKVVVFGQLVGIFLAGFLERHYKNNYVFDFRDLSYERSRLFKRSFRRLTSNARFVSISSPAYRPYFPVGTNLVLSHNVEQARVKNALAVNYKQMQYGQIPVKISVIGGIRTYDVNRMLIDELGNDDRFEVFFSGGGVSIPDLTDYTSANNFKNVHFTGYYKKEVEESIYENTDIVYIFLPDTNNFSTAMSNRMYNSLLYKKPFIVNKDDIQGKYSKEYGVGLRIDDTFKLGDKILEYLKSLDSREFYERCNKMLRDVSNDIELFNDNLLSFVQE